jgi:hypothetical protein
VLTLDTIYPILQIDNTYPDNLLYRVTFFSMQTDTFLPDKDFNLELLRTTPLRRKEQGACPERNALGVHRAPIWVFILDGYGSKKMLKRKNWLHGLLRCGGKRRSSMGQEFSNDVIWHNTIFV